MWNSTHRQRKDQYFKTLESEVLRLRASEVSLTLQVQDLQNHVEALQATPERHGMSPFCAPHDRSKIPENDGHPTGLDPLDTKLPTHPSSQNLDIDILSTRSPKTHNQEIDSMDTPQPAFISGPATHLIFSHVTYDKLRGLDMIGAGMEFVLAYVSLPTQTITLCFI